MANIKLKDADGIEHKYADVTTISVPSADGNSVINFHLEKDATTPKEVYTAADMANYLAIASTGTIYRYKGTDGAYLYDALYQVEEIDGHNLTLFNNSDANSDAEVYDEIDETPVSYQQIDGHMHITLSGIKNYVMLEVDSSKIINVTSANGCEHNSVEDEDRPYSTLLKITPKEREASIEFTVTDKAG